MIGTMAVLGFHPYRGRPMRTCCSLALLLPFTVTSVHAHPAVLPDAKAAPLVVVVFTGTACPVNTAYMPTLAKLHAEYSGKGVTFISVNAVPSDDAKAVAE